MSSLTPITGTLGLKRAKHLLNRLTFGPTKERIDAFAAMTITEALDELLLEYTPVEEPRELTNDDVDNPLYRLTYQDNAQVIQWWLSNMLQGNGLIEKMIFFYHTHFTTMESRVEEPKALRDQLQLFRKYALGSFKSLSYDICFDHAMMAHLDSTQNIKGRPNENFAREFLELYTIGKGPQVGEGDYTTYTEQDVQEGARVLSGFIENLSNQTEEITLGTIDPSRHDYTDKEFSTAFGQRKIVADTTLEPLDSAFKEVQDMVDMIFDQEATGVFLLTRLYRYFLYADISPDALENVIKPLAAQLKGEAYEIKEVLKVFFSSQHFFDEDNADVTDNIRGAIIKSPLDLTVGAYRFFKFKLPDNTAMVENPDMSGDPEMMDEYATALADIYSTIEEQGMRLYEPPEVAGYQAYHQAPVFHRFWITPNNIAYRYLLYTKLLDEGMMMNWDILEYFKDPLNSSDPSDAEQLVSDLIDYIFPEIITPERKQGFITSTIVEQISDNYIENLDYWRTQWNDEMQEMNVRNKLALLVKMLMESPEHQLY
ncbi:DUF1800 domain-containing protein [Algivirga pacifica]|uniref:DUF1800 domain-containing protein n=1 Tax=Algivirga pacifica TaxID=1162670 RepID=A0ABP9DGC5_9BACT